MMRESMLPTANISARAGYTCPDLAEPYKAPPATETPDPSAVLVTSLWEAPKEGLEVVPLIVEGEDAGLWTVPVQEEAIPGWWLVHVYALPGSKVAFTQVAVNATEPRPVTVVTVEHDGTPRIGTASEVLELLGSKVLRDKHAEEQRRLTVALAEEAMERRRLWEQERAAASAVPPTVEEPVLGQNPTPEGSGDDAAEVSPEEDRGKGEQRHIASVHGALQQARERIPSTGRREDDSPVRRSHKARGTGANRPSQDLIRRCYLACGISYGPQGGYNAGRSRDRRHRAKREDARRRGGDAPSQRTGGFCGAL